MTTATTESSIEARLATVERTIAGILTRLEKTEPTAGWLKQFRGCMSDEPGFADFVRHGREFRQADRPSDTDTSA
jgi:transposase